MPSALHVPNAIIWAQLHLLGGPRKLISFAVFYAILLVGGLVGVRRAPLDLSLGQYCDGAISVMAVIQMVLLIPGGCNAVFRGISRDINTQMLESHRLSPMKARNVILGYMFGPTLQVFSLYLVGIIVGVGIIRFGGTLGLRGWFLGNLYLLVLGVMTWSASVVLAVGPRKPISPIGVLIGLWMSSAGTMFFPAIGLGAGVYLAFIASYWMSGNNWTGDTLPLLVAAYTLLMAFIWAKAATRKYTRPDLPVFGVIGGLAMMSLCLATNAAVVWAIEGGALDNLGANLPRGMLDGLYDKIPAIHIVNLTAGMLFAMIAVGASAHARIAVARGADPGKRVSRGSPILVPMIATILIVAAGVSEFRASQTQRTIETMLAILFSLFAFESLMTLLHVRGQRAWAVILMFIIVFWALPVAGDSIRAEIVWDSYSTSNPELSQLFACSPVGIIITNIAEEVDVDARLGLVVQMVVAVIFGLFAHRACQRIRRETKESM